MPYYANSSNYDDKSYANQEPDYIIFSAVLIIIILAAVLIIIGFFIWSPIMESLRSTKKHTPKLYYQFWPFQFFILGYGAYFMYKNYDRATVIVMMAMMGLGLGIILIIICVSYMCTINMYITNTPTHCCTGKFKKCCHHTLESLSMVCCFSFILFVITAAPTIILVYYVYPTRTLVRLPFIISAIIYINSLAALLLFQCERALYTCRLCVDDDDKDDNPDDKDDDYDVKKEDKYHKRFYKIGNKFSFHLILYVIIPFITFFLLVVLIMGVVILSGLAFNHSNNFKDNQLQTLIALLPSFILFFGSLYRRDLFITDHTDEIEAKSEKEFLHEILQELKKEKSSTNTGSNLEMGQMTETTL